MSEKLAKTSLKLILKSFLFILFIVFLFWGLLQFFPGIKGIEELLFLDDVIYKSFRFIFDFMIYPFVGIFTFSVTMLFPVTVILVITNTILVPILEKNNKLFDLIHKRNLRRLFVLFTVLLCLFVFWEYAFSASFFEAYLI